LDKKNNAKHISNPFLQIRIQRIFFFSSIVVQKQHYMPLIEVEHFATTVKFLENLYQAEAPVIIQTWVGSTPYQVFINRYKYRLIQYHKYNPLSHKSGIEAQELLQEYIFGVNIGDTNIGLEYNFKMFIEAEKYIFREASGSTLTSDLIILREEYLNFLDEISNKLERIYRLSQKVFHASSKLSEKLVTVSYASLLKMEQCDTQITQVFKELDAISEVFEKSFKEESEEPVLVRENFPNMDWEYFKNPFQLEGYPEAINEFIRAVIAYCKEEMYERKTKLFWTKTPNTYLVIEEFIEELKQAIAQQKGVEQLTVTVPESKNKREEEYARFIFASQEAYSFFCLLASKATTPKQLSFIFREMSEKENPPMIVVKDTPFRDWFNEQPFEMNLEGYTATYQNAINSDRIWAYNIAKQLFFNK